MSEETTPSRTKIVATVGPASSSPEMLKALILNGVRMVRINASHGTHESCAETIARVRKVADELRQTVGVLFDLQGPKIRLGNFDGGPRAVHKGDTFVIAVDRTPAADEFPTDYALLDADVRAGHRLLIDDGALTATVVEVKRGSVRCRALNDAEIAPRKGINLPDSDVSAPAVTEKDRQDTFFAIEQQVDALALSFVRRGADVHGLRTVLESRGASIPIISKIEKPQALDNLPEILEASWGVMVARGDLGVELSLEEVPMAQKRIIHTARRMHKPVITATQMLESMTRNLNPTRAETSDVANAVLDGTDAVMLSQETAAGKYPLESVQMMTRIIRATENFSPYDAPVPDVDSGRPEFHTPEAVSLAACEIARNLRAKALVAFTQSGMTALLTASRRPATPIMAFTNRAQVRNVLSLVWGVHPYLLGEVNDTDALIAKLDATLIQHHLARPGDRLVVLMGAPTRRMGTTNLVLVYTLGHYFEAERTERES